MTYIPFTPTPEHVKILEEVKKRLECLVSHPDAGLRYVCIEIIQSFDYSIETEKEDLREWIAHMIYPWGSLRTWLMFVAGVPFEDATDHNMLIYRIEWVEHLIQTLEEHIS